MLKPGADLTFKYYETNDDGVKLVFIAEDPGPGEESLRDVFLTHEEIAASTNIVLLIFTKLQRKYRASEAAPVLNKLLGQTFTV